MDYLKQRSESLSSHPARSWLLEEGARTNQPDDATAGPAASRRGEGPGPAGAAATAAAKRGARAIFSGGATGSRLGARERKREGRGGFVPGQGVGRSGGKPKLFRPGLAPKRATVEEDRPFSASPGRTVRDHWRKNRLPRRAHARTGRDERRVGRRGPLGREPVVDAEPTLEARRVRGSTETKPDAPRGRSPPPRCEPEVHAALDSCRSRYHLPCLPS
jgi:hypothetical protein